LGAFEVLKNGVVYQTTELYIKGFYRNFLYGEEREGVYEENKNV